MVAFGAETASAARDKEYKKTGVACLRASLLCVGVTVGLFFAAAVAHAAPYIPFDAETQADGFSYGFVDPGSYGIDPMSIKRMETYYTAARSDDAANADSALLLVDPVSFVRCPRASDDCDSNDHVFDVEWDITFNGDVLGDAGGGSHLVDLILVDSDPDRDFRDLFVDVDFGQTAELDGEDLTFDVASYRDGDFYFIAAALGEMMDGDTKRLSFSYRIHGDLPLAGGGDVGFLFPTILPAAYLPAVVPEPGTGMMLGLGMIALARRGRRIR